MSEMLRTNFHRPAFAGLAVIALVVGAGLAWASIAKVSGAVIAAGAVGVSGKPKTIQHLDGGIIEAILVEAGQTVKSGDVLAELDDRAMLANLTIYRNRLRDALVRKERLLAELDDAQTFAAPDSKLIELFVLTGVDEAIVQQLSMMTARRTSRLGEVRQMDERIKQFRKQIEGVSSLKASKAEQLGVYGKERAAIDILVQKSIAARHQLLSFDRAAADLNGQIAEHDAEIGRLNNSISEVEISKLQVERKFREEAVSELDQLEGTINDLSQQVEATGQQLQRTIIRAPVSGIVHELSIHTIGGVIQPGAAIMQIVPASDRREVEVNVDINQIDRLHTGQKAVVRFPSFNQRTTPEISGTVARVSPASVTDERTGFSFYRVGVAIDDVEIARLGNQPLIPGMPVEAIIPTEERTVIAYLFKPLMDNFQHVFREE